MACYCRGVDRATLTYTSFDWLLQQYAMGSAVHARLKRLQLSGQEQIEKVIHVALDLKACNHPERHLLRQRLESMVLISGISAQMRFDELLKVTSFSLVHWAPSMLLNKFNAERKGSVCWILPSCYFFILLDSTSTSSPLMSFEVCNWTLKCGVYVKTCCK